MADTSLGVARNEFILGGQKSGKSRRAGALAHQWRTTLVRALRRADYRSRGIMKVAVHRPPPSGPGRARARHAHRWKSRWR